MGLFNLALECGNERCVARTLPLPEPPHDQDPSTNYWLDDLAENENVFLSAIRVLRDFSFVNQVSGSDGYAIHPVLHHWARTKVSASQTVAYLNSAAAILGRATPLAHAPHAWLISRRLTPHIDRFWHLLEQQKDFVTTAADGFNGLGFYEYDRSNYKNSERAMELALECWLRTVGLEHPVGLQCFFDLALSWRALGKYDKAEARMLEVFHRCNALEGPLARLTLRSADDLGRVYLIKGQYEKALEYFLRALEGKTQAHGPNDIVTLDTIGQITLLY